MKETHDAIIGSGVVLFLHLLTGFLSSSKVSLEDITWEDNSFLEVLTSFKAFSLSANVPDKLTILAPIQIGRHESPFHF